ncbi:MAG: T9SS type A sorting domain-containing protein [Bacteroidetes bacterium]|nr:T9SS type A sorting domain-containing protein [Bacteroidota bacterium]
MKKILFTIFFAIPFVLISMAQYTITYTYDDAGNRLLRETVTTCLQQRLGDTTNTGEENDNEFTKGKNSGDNGPDNDVNDKNKTKVIKSKEEFESGDTWFTISPNPSTGIFTLSCQNEYGKCQIANMEITDVLGRMVLQSAILNPQSAIDLSSHSPGLYFVKVITEDGTFVEKLVVQ